MAEAVAALKELAAEHGLHVSRRSADLSAADFDTLAASVAAAGGNAERILACERHCAGPAAQGGVAAPPPGGPAGIVEVEAPTQFADGGNDPAVEHAMVAQPAAAPAAAPANALALLPRAFRLRCSSVLFTYNSRTPPPLFGSDQVGWAR